MKNGLYRVVTARFVAGFVTKDNRVISIAPILRNKIKHFINEAEYLGP